MRRDLFLIPSLRRAIGAVPPPSLDLLFSNGTWPTGITADSLDNFLLEWSGVVRGLMLAGYDVSHVRVEVEPINQSELHELDLNTLRLGGFPPVSDDLDALRASGPDLLISWVVIPRQLYRAAGPPLALDLSGALSQVPAVTRTFTDTEVGHLAVPVTGHATLADAKWTLRTVALDIGAALAATLAPAFASTPDWQAASGLMWALDPRQWRFPPDGRAHSEPPAVSHSHGGQAVRDALVGPWTALEQGALDPQQLLIDQFFNEQVTRHNDPTTWHPAGRVRKVIRELQGSGSGADALQNAAYQRSLETEEFLTAAAAALIEVLPGLGYVDAMLALIERGLVDPFWNVELRENGLVAPEWTDPALTGQWDEESDPSSSRLATNTILLNQAGDRLEGYWQAPYTTGTTGSPESGGREYERWTLSADRDSSASGLAFDLKWWDQPGHAVEPHDRDALGAPDGTGTMVFTDVGGGLVALDVSYDDGSGGVATQRFVQANSDPHHTTRTLEMFPPSLADRYRTTRDAPLHVEHLPPVDAAIDVILQYLHEWEDAHWDGSFQRAQNLDTDLAAALPDLWWEYQGWQYSDQLATVQDELRWRLSRRPDPASATYWEALVSFMHRVGHPVSRLQALTGIHVPTGSANLHRWQWRLQEVYGLGFDRVVGAQLSSAAIQFRKVDAQGRETGVQYEYPAILLRGSLGFSFGVGFGEKSTPWAPFYAVTDDWTEDDFRGASISMIWFEASFTVLELSSAGNVWVESSQHGKRLEGILDAKWSDPITDPWGLMPEHPENLKEVEDKLEKLKQFRDVATKFVKQGAHRAWNAIKEGKLIQAKGNYLYGWIDRDQPPDPEDLAVLDPTAHMTGFSGALFESGDAELTDDYREVVRRLLCAYLPILRSSAGELTLIGTASNLGTEEDNIELSRQRAITVLQAIRDILGPQLTLPPGAIGLYPLGETLANGDPHSDLPGDRRVDVLLGGRVALRG